MRRNLLKVGRVVEQLRRSSHGACLVMTRDITGPPLEDIAEEEEQPEEEEEDIGDEDDMADFIVLYIILLCRRRKLNKKKPRLCKQGLAKAGKYDGSGEWRERRLEDEFKPIVLSKKCMIEKDIHMRKEDILERMQIYKESTGPPLLNEMSIEEESNWIYNQLMTCTIPLLSEERCLKEAGQLNGRVSYR
ncbi:global transcription factor group B1 [Actinidia rufa]|uniref:Global transcription factor group B1 n=1 Tax=Actinidia rufa TaxID=165716 RepID=A0A7J0DVK6_9ERIC|nr:global transcription factor group B1 [Actinidia rufa]